LEKNTDSTKEKISGIVFARACCIIKIVIFHFFCHSNSEVNFLYIVSNTGRFVTVFFAISGAVLFYNYPEISSLRIFYYKRWKSIFPAFYLCFIYFYIRNVFLTHHIFYAGNPLTLIFTLFGMDGFFLYRFPNYYIIGEWFLGAIIFLYLLYPLVNSLFRRNIIIVPIFLIIGFVFMLETSFFKIDNSRNLITCLTSFYFGMVAMKYRNFFLKDKYVGISSSIILIALCFFRISSPKIQFIFEIVQSWLLFIFLIQLGNFLMNFKCNILFEKISNLSFQIFLLHHIIILDFLGLANPTKWYKSYVLLLASIIFTIICAKILSVIVTSVLKNNMLKKIENSIINKA